MTRAWTPLWLATLLLLLATSVAVAQTRLGDDLGWEEEGFEPAVDTSSPDGTLPGGNVPAAGTDPDDEALRRAIANVGVDRHVVQPGDTLWDICSRVLGSPWYWQKVWAMNQHITNPHWIEPGDVIYFQAAGQVGAMVASEPSVEAPTADQLANIPEILDPDAWGTVTEGGQYRLDNYLSRIQSNAFNFYNFRRDGFISQTELRDSGVISNSPSPRDLLIEMDNIYIKPEDVNTFTIGQEYQIFRDQGKIKHPVTGESLGYKIRVLGRAVVKRISKGVVTAQIVESYDVIERGDLVRPWRNPVKDIRPRRNKVTLQGYVVDSLFDSLVLGEHQVLFLDKGISDGVEEGNRFFVIRRFDGAGHRGKFKTEDLPYEKVGEMIVLSTGAKTCVALLTRSLLPVEISDRVIMEKNY